MRYYLLTILPVVLLVMIAIPAVVMGQSPEEEFISGGETWTITSDLTIESETLCVGRNITVARGATLTLRDSSLIFFPNETKPHYNFIVEEGATLLVENSRISANTSYMSFIMWCYGEVTIKDSTITNLASVASELSYVGGIVVMSNDTVIQGNKIHFGNVGVSVMNCHRITMKDNVINDTYIALYSEGSSVEISNNEIRDTVYGIYDQDCDNTYSGNNIYRAFEGIYTFASRSRFTQNVINNSNLGAVVIGCDNVSLDNNTFLDNNKAVQGLDGSLSIKDNTVTGGIDGINLEFMEVEIISNTFSGQEAIVTEVTDCTGCTKPQLDGWGSCIHLFKSDALIDSNTMNASNIGVYSEFCSPVITNNVISYMTDPQDCNTSCRVGPSIITFDSISLITGVGILMKSQGEDPPVISDNTISNNQNDGVFLMYSQASFQGNLITENGGYGIQTMGMDIDSSMDDKFFNKKEAFAYSIFVTFRIYDPYGDIVTYSGITIGDPVASTTYTQSNLDLGYFSAILVSYTSSEPKDSADVSEYRSYDITFTGKDATTTTEFLAEPGTPSTVNVTVPLYRPDLSVVDIEITDPYKGEGNNVKAVVRNSGDAVARNVTVNFFWSYLGESRVFGTNTITVIEPGQEIDIVVDWTPEEAGEYVVSVELDPNHEVKEVQENNNEVSEMVTVEEEREENWVILVGIMMVLLFLVILAIIAVTLLRKKEPDLQNRRAIRDETEMPMASQFEAEVLEEEEEPEEEDDTMDDSKESETEKPKTEKPRKKSK